MTRNLLSTRIVNSRITYLLAKANKIREAVIRHVGIF